MSADLTKAARCSPSSFWPALIIVFLGSFVGMYHVVSLNILLHGFMDIFDSELQQVQWIITGFALTCGIVAPVSGYAIDRFGSKQMFLLAIAGITISSLLCASAWSIQSLIVFRIVQGLFCGFIQPISLAMIYRTITKDKQIFAVSVWSFSAVLSTSIGPSISGWLQGHDWHYIFLVTVPVGVATLIGGIIILPQDQENKQISLDWVGLLLATCGSLAFLMLFGNMNAWGFRSSYTGISLFVGVVCLIFFIKHELRTQIPLLQLKLLRNPTFALSLSASLILTFGIYAGVYFMPLFLEEIQGLTPFQVGLVFLPAAVCLTCATFFSGKVYSKYGPSKLLGTGSVILFITTYYCSQLRPDTSLSAVMLVLSLRNIGTGLAMTPITNVSMSSVPEEHVGQASALINWLRQVFSAMALGLCTSLFYTRMEVHEKRLVEHSTASIDAVSHQTAYVLSINDAFLVASLIIVTVIPITLILSKKLSLAQKPSIKVNETL